MASRVLVFFESPVGFTIHITDAKSQQCVDLFNYAIRENKALKVFALKNSHEITQVNQVESESINVVKLEEYLATKSRSVTGNYPNYWKFENLVESCRHACNWYYSGEGCYARAHAIYQNFKSKGYDCYKIFIFGNLSARNCNVGCCAKWNWHVAAIVKYYTKDSLINIRVLDFSASKTPMKINDWVEACTNKDCSVYAKLDLPWQILDGEVYKYNPYKGEIMLDPNFEHADCILDVYDFVDGCESVRANCGNDSWVKK